MKSVPSAYLMIKPTLSKAAELRGFASKWKLAGHYASHLLHITVLKLGNADDLPDAALAILDHAFAILSAESFYVALDRFNGAELIGGKGLNDLRGFQSALKQRVSACGLWLPPANFRPHVTLSYKELRGRAIEIRPIGWWVEEVMLVVSHNGKSRHEVLGRWALNTCQMGLPFAA
jgi:2'-5' RNA ligase